MNFSRVGTSQTASDTLIDLSIIPQKVQDIVIQTGIKTYCFNKNIYPSWIGLFDKGQCTEDGRSTDNTACFSPSNKAIVIYDWDFDKTEVAFSVVLHEFAHALDYALGLKNNKNSYFSCINPVILKGWEKEKGLDWYANLNPMEYFAQAFMAYFMTNKTTYKPSIYYEHTQEELKLKDSNMFYFLDNLIKNI